MARREPGRRALGMKPTVGTGLTGIDAGSSTNCCVSCRIVGREVGSTGYAPGDELCTNTGNASGRTWRSVRLEDSLHRALRYADGSQTQIVSG